MCYRMGWECPRCHRIHSPDVYQCWCIPNVPSVWIDWPGVGTGTLVDTHDYTIVGVGPTKIYSDKSG